MSNIINPRDLSEGRVPCAICGQLIEPRPRETPIVREDGDGHMIWAAHGKCSGREEKMKAQTLRP